MSCREEVRGVLVRLSMPGAPERPGRSLIGEKPGQRPERGQKQESGDGGAPSRASQEDRRARRVEPRREEQGGREQTADRPHAVDRDRETGEGERQRPALERG